MRRLGLLLAGLLALVAPPAAAELTGRFLATLSQERVALSIAFNGDEIQLFAVNRLEDGDVVAVVRGYEAPATVGRRTPVGPLWLETQSATFPLVPSYYCVAANHPPDSVGNPGDLRRHAIGIPYLPLEPLEPLAEAHQHVFREALVRLKRTRGLFCGDLLPIEEKVNRDGIRLMRLRLPLPSTAPEGVYTVELYSFRDGRMTAADSVLLELKKTGIEAWLTRLALDHPLLYGALACTVAVLLGLSAGLIPARR